MFNKKWLAILGLFSFLLSLPGQAQTATGLGSPPLSGQKVLWIGDSITHQADFVSFVEYYLSKNYPDATFDIIEIGRPSETVNGASESTHPGHRPCVMDRLQRALDLIKPNLVVACYGMNDGIYHPQSPERMQLFQDGMTKFISTCKAAGATVVLMTPPPWEKLAGNNLLPKDAPDFSYLHVYEDYDSVLTDYTAWEKTLPSTDVTAVIDIHTAMAAYLAQRRQTEPKFLFAHDTIHPDQLGNLQMADTILQTLGVPLGGADADLDQQLAAIKADPLFALIKKQHGDRSNAWMDYIGAPKFGEPAAAQNGATVDKEEAAYVQLQTQIDALRKKSSP